MFENNEYIRYEFEPTGPEQLPHNDFQTPPSGDGKKPKHSGGAKLVALALSCALVGGVGGGAIVGTFYQNQPAAPAMAQTEQSTAETDGKVISTVSHKVGDKSMTPKAVYNQNVSSVVGITTSGTTTNAFGQVSKFASSGSGFVVTTDGYIVTNHHVIADASAVSVTFHDGTSYDAKIVGSDAGNDVALLKVEATGLDAVSIGDSDTLEVGDQVAAIGNPLGELTYTLTVGYVSALDRAINTDGTPINMFQTDVAINSGNSGGPLFDMNGNVIGVTTAKYSGNTSSGSTIEGIGFAIPINDVSNIVNDLKEHGYVTGQAYLGVSVKDLDATTAKYYNLPVGTLVASVTEGSCAEKAGILEGDIITALGDKTVEDYSDLATALKRLKAGDTTTITIYRAGQSLDLDVTLDEKLPVDTTTEQTAETPQQPQEVQPKTQTPNEFPFGEFFFGN